MKTPSFRKPFRHSSPFAIGLVTTAILLAHIHAAHYSWTGNWDSNWADTRNWSPSGIPGSGDDATISSGYSNAAGSRTLQSLTISGGSVGGLDTLISQTLTISSGSLSATTIQTEKLNASGGAVYATTATLSGDSTWTGGRIQTSVTVLAGASISIPSGLPDLAYMTLVNNGTVTMSGGQIRGYDNAIIENHGTWLLTGSTTGFTYYHGGNQFNNHGLLHKSGSTITPLSNSSWTYNLAGEVRSDEGTLQLVSTTNLPAGTQLTGTGTIQIIGTVNLSGTVTESVANLEIGGGTLVCSGTAAVTGTLSWLEGYISGSLTIPNGSTLSVSGDPIHRLNSYASIDNYGTIVWSGSAPIQGYNANTITNHATGVFDIAANGTPFSYYHGGHDFINNGTLKKSAGPGTATLISWIYQNNGTLLCDTGTLECQSTTLLNDGSTLEGTAEIRLNGTTTLSGITTETVANLRMTGGALTGISPCGIVGQLDWEAGTIYGTLGVPTSSVLAVHGEGFKQIGGQSTVSVSGSYVWSGPGAVELYENSTLHIQTGGTCDLAADGDPFDHYHGGNELINEGTLVKSAGAGGSTTCDTLTIRNRGDIRCDTSTLEFTSSNTLVFEDTSTVSGTGDILLSAAMLLPGSVDISAPTTWTAGTLTGQGGSMTGQLDWSGGYSSGSWQVSSGGRLKVIDGAFKRFNRSSILQVGGTLEIASAGFEQYENSLIQVLAGGTCEVTGTAAVTTYHGGNVLQVDDGGLFTATAAGDLRIDSALTNNGTVSLPAGTVAANGGGGPSTGTYHVETGASFSFTNGTHDLDTGSTATGPGYVGVTGGNLRAIAPVDAFVHLEGGTVEGQTPDGIFRFRDGSSWTSGYMSGNVRIPTTARLYVNASGDELRRMNTSARLDIEGTLHWQGPGHIEPYQANTIEIHPTGTLDLTTDGTPFDQYHGNTTLTNNGTILKSGGAGDALLVDLTYTNTNRLQSDSGRLRFHAPLTLADGGTISGAARTVLTGYRTTLEGTTTIDSSTIELAGAELYGTSESNSTLAGQNIVWTSGSISGQVTWNGIATTSSDGFRRINSYGELRNAGTLTLTGGGSVQCYWASTLRNLPGATLNTTGATTVSYYHGGNLFINEGTMDIGASSGRMIISVPFQQTSTGTLVVGVAGPSPDFDVLEVRETATLDGTLVASMEGGYDPTTGTSFEVVDAYTRVGTFSQTQAPRFDVTYPYTTGDTPVSQNNVVLVSKDADTLDYDTWANEHDLEGEDALPGSDPDADGSSNWIEYALNMDPNAADTQPVTSTLETTPEGDFLVLRYRRWDNRVSAGVFYTPERSSNLTGWFTFGITDETDPDAASMEGSEARKASVPVDATSKFLHLRISDTESVGDPI